MRLLAPQYPLSRSGSGLAGFLVQVYRFEVLVEHFLHQASVFLYVPHNGKGDSLDRTSKRLLKVGRHLGPP
jgi:hypothetical protein